MFLFYIDNDTLVCLKWSSALTNKLSELANLEVGKQYTFSFKTTSTRNYIWINGAGVALENGKTYTITQAMLDGKLAFYSYDTSDSQPAVYSNIQIEEGAEATDYQPYNGAIVHEKDNPHPMLDCFSLTLNANQIVDYSDRKYLQFDIVPNNEYFKTNTDRNVFTALKDCKIKINGTLVFKDPTFTKVDVQIETNYETIFNSIVRSSTTVAAINNMFFDIGTPIIDMKAGDRFTISMTKSGIGDTTAVLTKYYTYVNVEVFKS